MKFTTPFAALRNATADMRMHDFNYQLPQKESQIINSCKENFFKKFISTLKKIL